jgi:hypothetical protein
MGGWSTDRHFVEHKLAFGKLEEYLSAITTSLIAGVELVF